MIVAIHQPNFFPWLGYFDKLAKADRFIILDDVEFSKSGSHWSKRVKCLLTGGPEWLVGPIDGDHGPGRPYREVRFQSGSSWRQRNLRVLQNAYRRAPSFDEVMDFLTPLLTFEDDSLTLYNLNAIVGIASALGIDCSKIVRSSDLPTDASGTERLIQLTEAVSGTAYLCGGGAGGYQQDELFEKAGIALRYQDFESRPYPQVGSPDQFVPGLSVMDALLNVGVERTREMLT